MKSVSLGLAIASLAFVLSACEGQKPLQIEDYPAKQSLPDFAAISDVNQKKQQFTDYMLPMVEHANQQFLNTRLHLLNLQQHKHLNKDQQAELAKIAERFRVDKSLSVDQQIEQLLVKVDVLPPALVLAQAANESAWGTSRFATKANNFFGQWCFSEGCGLVPLHRNEGATHEVASFESPYDSVLSYMININRHQAYAGLREARAKLRSQGELDAFELAKYLSSYSERGQAYVEELSAMMRVNGKYWPNPLALNKAS